MMTFQGNILVCVFAAALVSAAAFAQVPVEERSRPLQQGQYRAGIAHRALEQARYEAKLAEQDVLNARDAHAAAQKETDASKRDASKRELDTAEKALTAARARVAAAQKDYDRKVNAVDAAHRAAPTPGK